MKPDGKDGQGGGEMSTFSGLRRFALGALRGRPRTVFLEVTLRCNARCDFCRYWRLPVVEEVKDFRPIVARFSPVSVTLTGGEPLVRSDICDLVAGIRSTGDYFISLITNGIKLDIEKARRLRAAGLDGLSVSLNYPNELQDREKGVPGLYRKLADVLPGLRRLGFRRLSLNTVLMANNLGWIPSIVERAQAWGMGLTVSCYSPGKAGLHSPVIGQDQSNELRDVVELLKREHGSGCVENSFWYLDRIEPFHRQRHVAGCLAGRRTIHVTSQGMVRPCPELPIVSHWSSYDARKAPLPRCGVCWYACRGEVEAPLTLARIRELARYVGTQKPPSKQARNDSSECLAR